MHGNSLIELYNHYPSTWIKADADNLAFFLLERHTKTPSGVLPYRQSNKNSVLVDTLGMICPFLTKYGVRFNYQPAVDLASKQLREFIDKGISSDFNLPYHGYNYLPEKNLGGDGWGRGLGWFLLGIIGVLELLPKSDVNYQFFLGFYRSLIEQVFNKQGKCGAFSVQLLDERSTPDSGATGMIAYACAKGVELNLIDKTYFEHCIKAFEYILSVTDKDGRVQECSGEALGANNYSNEKGWYPWGQGPAVSLGASLLKQCSSLNT
jgi:unsaturated rhamnogalacturonyl hydrolase